MQLTSVAPYREEPNQPLTFYCTGNDKTIKEFSGTGSEFALKKRYENQAGMSQVALMHKRKAIFVGLDETQKPGSIQVLRYPFEKTYEVQAHALPVSRMRISYDNSTLFSVSSDGTFCVFNI